MIAFAVVNWTLILGIVTFLTPIVFAGALLYVRDVIRKELAPQLAALEPKADVKESFVRLHRRIDEEHGRERDLEGRVNKINDRVAILERRADVMEERLSLKLDQLVEQGVRTEKKVDDTADKVDALSLRLAKLP